MKALFSTIAAVALLASTAFAQTATPPAAPGQQQARPATPPAQQAAPPAGQQAATRTPACVPIPAKAIDGGFKPVEILVPHSANLVTVGDTIGVILPQAAGADRVDRTDVGSEDSRQIPVVKACRNNMTEVTTRVTAIVPAAGDTPAYVKAVIYLPSSTADAFMRACSNELRKCAPAEYKKTDSTVTFGPYKDPPAGGPLSPAKG